MQKIDFRKLGIRLGLISLALRILVVFFPSVCEYLYSRGLFIGIRCFFDYTTARLPFPMIYILFVVLMYLLLKTIYKILKTSYLKINKKINNTWRSLLRGAAYNMAAFLGWTLTYFLWILGFNYARIPLDQQMGIRLDSMTHQQLMAEAEWILKKCPEVRAQIPDADTFALNEKHYAFDMEAEMRGLLVRVLDSLHYPTYGRVRGRLLYPKGTLYRFAASGVYMPFVGEGQVDAAQLPMQQPFTMAHELAHGYGFGDEAECNFLGYLACMASSNPAIRYSGYLSYWRYIFVELKLMDYGCYKELRAQVPRGMFNDLEAIYDNNDSYPPFFPDLQDWAYELYLQSQGVKEGQRSYNKMVLFVAATRE